MSGALYEITYQYPSGVIRSLNLLLFAEAKRVLYAKKHYFDCKILSIKVHGRLF